MGAVVCINYKDENTLRDKINKIASNPIYLGFDQVSSCETLNFDVKLFLFHYPPHGILAG